jgi:hypothetical protein
MLKLFPNKVSKLSAAADSLRLAIQGKLEFVSPVLAADHVFVHVGISKGCVPSMLNVVT